MFQSIGIRIVCVTMNSIPSKTLTVVLLDERQESRLEGVAHQDLHKHIEAGHVLLRLKSEIHKNQKELVY